MKKLITIATITVLAISIFSLNANAKKKENEKTLTFIVSMDCHSCVQKIESNIPFEKGVKDLNISLDKKECEVTFNKNKTNAMKLVEAFNKLGYTATIKLDENKKSLKAEPQNHINHKHEDQK
jgi:copper chaperone CopZ